MGKRKSLKRGGQTLSRLAVCWPIWKPRLFLGSGDQITHLCRCTFWSDHFFQIGSSLIFTAVNLNLSAQRPPLASKALAGGTVIKVSKSKRTAQISEKKNWMYSLSKIFINDCHIGYYE